MLRVRSFKETFALGPFRFVRLVEIHNIGGRSFVAGRPIGGVVGGMDTCAKCGSKLRYSYVIQANDGRRYAVGSRCLRKLGLTRPAIEKVRRAEQEMKQRRKRVSEKLRAARYIEMSGTWFHDPFRELPF